MATTAKLTDKERTDFLKESDTEIYLSMWPFLREQNGWRPGKTHLTVGPSGAGKSTFVRSVLTDFLYTNKKCHALVVLSEETCDDFKQEFNRLKFDDDTPERLHVISEQDEKFSSFSDYMNKIKSYADEIGIEFIICDNLTTSEFYAEKQSSEQISICKKWKSLAQELYVPVLVIAHTKKEITENFSSLIVPEHIRGSSNIVNISEFIYVLQPIHVGNDKFLFMRVCKNRGQEVKERIYGLYYHASKRIYGNIQARKFSEFVELFKTRNKL